MIEGYSRKAMFIPPGEGRKMFVIGHEITVKLATADTAGEAYVFEALTAPGVGVPPHLHEHEDELLRILRGEYEIFLAGRTFKVTEGAVINFPRLVPHGFRNISSESGRAIFTVVPGAKFEKFFDELGALPPAEAPNKSKIAEIFRRYDITILDPVADVTH